MRISSSAPIITSPQGPREQGRRSQFGWNRAQGRVYHAESREYELALDSLSLLLCYSPSLVGQLGCI